MREDKLSHKLWFWLLACFPLCFLNLLAILPMMGSHSDRFQKNMGAIFFWVNSLSNQFSKEESNPWLCLLSQWVIIAAAGYLLHTYKKSPFYALLLFVPGAIIALGVIWVRQTFYYYF